MQRDSGQGVTTHTMRLPSRLADILDAYGLQLVVPVFTVEVVLLFLSLLSDFSVFDSGGNQVTRQLFGTGHDALHKTSELQLALHVCSAVGVLAVVVTVYDARVPLKFNRRARFMFGICGLAAALNLTTIAVVWDYGRPLEALADELVSALFWVLASVGAALADRMQAGRRPQRRRLLVAAYATGAAIAAHAAAVEFAYLDWTADQSHRSLVYAEFAVAFRATLFLCETFAQKAFHPERRLHWATYEEVDCDKQPGDGLAELASRGSGSTSETERAGVDGYRALE
jgi:hypothetical protein